MKGAMFPTLLLGVVVAMVTSMPTKSALPRVFSVQLNNQNVKVYSTYPTPKPTVKDSSNILEKGEQNMEKLSKDTLKGIDPIMEDSEIKPDMDKQSQQTETDAESHEIKGFGLGIRHKPSMMKPEVEAVEEDLNEVTTEVSMMADAELPIAVMSEESQVEGMEPITIIMEDDSVIPVMAAETETLVEDEMMKDDLMSKPVDQLAVAPLVDAEITMVEDDPIMPEVVVPVVDTEAVMPLEDETDMPVIVMVVDTSADLTAEHPESEQLHKDSMMDEAETEGELIMGHIIVVEDPKENVMLVPAFEVVDAQTETPSDGNLEQMTETSFGTEIDVSGVFEDMMEKDAPIDLSENIAKELNGDVMESDNSDDSMMMNDITIMDKDMSQITLDGPEDEVPMSANAELNAENDDETATEMIPEDEPSLPSDMAEKDTLLKSEVDSMKVENKDTKMMDEMGENFSEMTTELSNDMSDMTGEDFAVLSDVVPQLDALSEVDYDSELSVNLAAGFNMEPEEHASLILEVNEQLSSMPKEMNVEETVPESKPDIMDDMGDGMDDDMNNMVMESDPTLSITTVVPSDMEDETADYPLESIPDPLEEDFALNETL